MRPPPSKRCSTGWPIGFIPPRRAAIVETIGQQPAIDQTVGGDVVKVGKQVLTDHWRFRPFLFRSGNVPGVHQAGGNESRVQDHGASRPAGSSSTARCGRKRSIASAIRS